MSVLSAEEALSEELKHRTTGFIVRIDTVSNTKNTIRNAITVVRQEGNTVSIDISDYIEFVCKQL